MRIRKKRDIVALLLLAITMVSYAAVSVFQVDPTRQNNKRQGANQQANQAKGKAQTNNNGKGNTTKLIDVVVDEDTIPDSLLHPRWKIQRTTPVTYDDLNQSAMDLDRPEGLKYDVTYNDTINRYIIATRMGSTYLAAPIMMTPEEYMKWSEKHERDAYFRSKNSEIFQAKGKEKFDFSDMHFDLGPAEKIFGPGGVRIKTQGTAELKFGATQKKIDNPSLPVRSRNKTTMDFDEKINFSLNGKVGDKVNMNLNYNTDATFDFDAQNMKLKYDGKEDEIIKLVEAGNISFPSNSSLVQGASSLFGLRTDLQLANSSCNSWLHRRKVHRRASARRAASSTLPLRWTLPTTRRTGISSCRNISESTTTRA